MADKKIMQISPEQVARINQIYDDRFALEEKWRLEDALDRKYEEGMEEGLEQGIEQGLEQGIEQGIEQGLSVGRRETIRKLLNKYTVEKTAEILDMSVEEIKALQN